jgi:hypothetical protein
MRTCSYCGGENDDRRAECHGCGRELSPATEPLRHRAASIRRLRIALGVIGIGGGLLWFLFGCLILLVQGILPGPQTGMSRGEWTFCIAAVLITLVYYAVVSVSIWSRGLLFTGIALHVLWVVAVIWIVTLSDGGFILMPLLLAGAACWIAFTAMAPHKRPLVIETPTEPPHSPGA